MRFESPFAAGLNHLLESESWARERLAPFAGETIELRLVKPDQVGIGEASKDQVAFARAAMPGSEQQPLAANLG